MNIDIARAWKDVDYRESLSEEQRALLPENPIGSMELTDLELATVFGGHEIAETCTCTCCSCCC